MTRIDNLQRSRQQRLAQLKTQQSWDMIVIGGGISGAGIVKLASQAGLKVLLLEQKDFAWGSSSRSSKMVHGGLRYIAEGQVGLTLESVRERQRLIQQARGLVKAQSFSVGHYLRQFPWPWIFNLLLVIYDFMAGKKQHRYWPRDSYQYLAPGIKTENLLGGNEFVDATTDDARLVLRLLQEAQQLGAEVINYVKVSGLLRENGRVVGVEAQPLAELPEQAQQVQGEPPLSLRAKIVINATGAWANQLLAQSERSMQLRPLRGSHLIVASWRLPVATGLVVRHPQDQRPVQIFPWQNVTVIGTTDVEHSQSLAIEPGISQAELDYLLACVAHQFPAARLAEKDIISSYAGVRPVVVSGGLVAPSRESRQHKIGQQPGLITIAGGKLTTFRVIAKEVLQLARELSPELALQLATADLECPIFEQAEKMKHPELPPQLRERIGGCYGRLAPDFIQQAQPQDLKTIGYSVNCWAELIWAMKYEQVQHLDDLLLRRTRLGNVLAAGGMDQMMGIKALCIEHLNWSETRWLAELERYRSLWLTCYSMPSK